MSDVPGQPPGSGEPYSYEPRPGEPRPGPARPRDARPGDARPAQPRPAQPRPAQPRSGQARRRPQSADSAAQRNSERRRRRAARAAARREERRRKERERRRQERIERGELTPPMAAPETPLVSPRSNRPEPPDPPGLAGLRSAAPRDLPDLDQPAATPGDAAESLRRPVGSTPAEEPTVIHTAGRKAEPVAPRGARRRAELRAIDPWSVFRLSLILYLCLLVVVTIGTVLFWLVLSRVPLLRDMLDQIERLGIPVDPGLVLSVLLPVGLLNVLLWSGVNLFFAVLYNVVADMFGGLRVTLSDEERL